MTAVKMYIDKFDREVLIDEDHELAVAQRAKGQAAPDSTNSVDPSKPLTATQIGKLNREQLDALAAERGVTVEPGPDNKVTNKMLAAAILASYPTA